MLDGSAVHGRSAVPAGYQVVDLSVTIAEDLPCYWEGHQPFQHKTWNWFADHRNAMASVYSRGGPYATRWMAIDEHTGTHFDAPLHFIPPPDSGLPGAGPAGAISADQVGLASLMGAAAVIDVASPGGGEGGMSPLIHPSAIVAWEAANGMLNPGEIVLLRTGWDRRYRRGAAGGGYLRDVLAGRSPGWPAPTEPTVELLLTRGVQCLGIDAPSIGPAHDPVGVHVRGLGQGMVYVECLAALDALPPRGAWFCFLPIKVEGSTGAPGRAIALMPATES
uniref:SalO n=1 Tax=Salinispora tropica TaxID=168695 RepID=B0L7F2_9ACTN|nr:SalO [Salinispora tropica]